MFESSISSRTYKRAHKVTMWKDAHQVNAPALVPLLDESNVSAATSG
jgi:hypothetical protein